MIVFPINLYTVIKMKKQHQDIIRFFLEDHNVNVELTTSKRTGYHKYSFKEEDVQSVIIDLGFAINWDMAG